jgi:hypothetical protein
VRTRAAVFAAALAIAASADAQSRGATASTSTPAPERIDYLTFAQGAVPIRIDCAGAKLGADYERAIRIIDGNPQLFTLTARPFGQDAGDTEFVYELPAPTTFDRFELGEVRHPPVASPSRLDTSRSRGAPRRSSHHLKNIARRHGASGLETRQV